MSTRDIFNDSLLLGNKIIVRFNSRKELLCFRSELQVAKRRLEESAAKFGLQSGTEHLSIRTQALPQEGLAYKIWLGPKETKQINYTIISSEADNTEQT